MNTEIRRRISNLTPEQRQQLRDRLRGDTRPAEHVAKNNAISGARFGIWLFEQLHPGTAAYNNPAGIRLLGELDRSALREAFVRLQSRHFPLRCVFVENEDGEPEEQNAGYPLEYAFEDLAEKKDRADEAKKLMKEFANRTFDLESGPVWRVLLVRLESDEHIVCITLHHIISDGWSLQVLFHDLEQEYLGVLDGTASPTDELDAQYAVVAAGSTTEKRSKTTLQRYWVERLKGAPEVVPLPYDTTPIRGSYLGSTVPLHASETITLALESQCSTQQTSLFSGLFAGFISLLHYYSNATDIVVTMPIAGRDDPATHSLLGCFLNTIALRIDLTNNPSFREIIRRTRNELVNALDHRQYPFQELVRKRSQQSISRERPISNVSFVHNNAPVATGRFATCQSSRYSIPLRSVKQDWTIICARTENGIEGEFEYLTDRFEHSRATEAASKWIQILELGSSRPDTSLTSLIA